MNEFEAMTANVADLNAERLKLRELIAAHAKHSPDKVRFLARAMIEVGAAALSSANEDYAARLLRGMRHDLMRGYVFDF